MGKINLTRNIGKRKININKKEQPSEEKKVDNIQSKEQEIIDKKRKKAKEVSDKLYMESVKALNNATIDVSFDIKEQEILKKRKRNKLIRNWSIATVCIFFIGSMFVFGVKNAFFTRNYTGEEIAALSNQYNHKTNFPEAGVYGFIKQNAQTLMKNNMDLYNNIANTDVGIVVKNTTVIAVSPRNDKEAAVLYQADLETTAGTQQVNCAVTVTWDGLKYGTLGEVSIYPREVPNKTSKPGNDPYKFPDDARPDDASMEEAKVFVDHFFDIYYKGQDVSPFYNGTAKLETPSKLEYQGIDSFVLMDMENKFGYNAKLYVTLRMPNGVQYKTLKYLSIKKEGKAWQIDKIY